LFNKGTLSYLNGLPFLTCAWIGRYQEHFFDHCLDGARQLHERDVQRRKSASSSILAAVRNRSQVGLFSNTNADKLNPAKL
jgi:hypothetical protein